MKYYVIYESYSEYNQFEGSWDLKLKEFDSIQEANKWLDNNTYVKECRLYNRTLIGPLVEVSSLSSEQ
jgi:hypothetical protein